MQTNSPRRLEEGQVWKVDQGYLSIEELGDRLIRYKMHRQPQTKPAITHFIRVEAMVNFLVQSEAQLVSSADRAIASLP